MFGRKRSQANAEGEIIQMASAFAGLWIVANIWQSESDTVKDKKIIFMKAAARVNFLLQKPVAVEHLHKLDLAREESIALDSLHNDVLLRTLVMQTQRLMEQIPGLEKPDLKLMEKYGAEYLNAPKISEFCDFIATLRQKLAPLQAKMNADSFFKKSADQGIASHKLTAWAVRVAEKDIANGRVTASMLFAKHLGIEKCTVNNWFITWAKAEARAYIVFDEPIPRGCARLLNLVDEEAAAIEAMQADSLLCELVVQSQRIIARIKLSEGQGTQWGMESQILGKFGGSYPRYMEFSQYSSYLKHIDKTLAPYKKQLEKLMQQIE